MRRRLQPPRRRRPPPPRGGGHLPLLLYSTTAQSQAWSPFRCFPEESYSLHGSSCHVALSVSACGEARTHCLVLQCAGAEVTISMGDAAEVAAWLDAAQAAAAARGDAPPSPRQGGEGGAHQETRRLEARAAAAREELSLVSSEAARRREATARTLGDCAYVLQVHVLLTTYYSLPTCYLRTTYYSAPRCCRGGGGAEGYYTLCPARHYPPYTAAPYTAPLYTAAPYV